MRRHRAHRPGHEAVRDPFAGLDVPEFLLGKDRAACADHPPELWFRDGAEALEAVKAICHNCPLYFGCKEYAITHQEAGIWAGLTQHMRTIIRHKREAAA